MIGQSISRSVSKPCPAVMPARVAFSRRRSIVPARSMPVSPQSLRYLWLFVPLAGVTEPVLAAYQAHRTPKVEQWLALKPRVAALAGPRDLIVVAPEWA